jgi:long-chain acyl-CoA synthetase
MNVVDQDLVPLL